MTELQLACQRLEDAQQAVRRTRLSVLAVGTLTWLVVLGGCIYQSVNVTRAATDDDGADIPGWIAWMLDPLAIATLAVTVLVGQTLAANGKREGWRILITRVAASAATIGLNVMGPLTEADPTVHKVLPHAVIPALMALLIEVAAWSRLQFAQIIAQAERKQLDIARDIARLQAAHDAAALQRREAEARLEMERQERDRRDQRFREADERAGQLELARIQAQAEQARAEAAAAEAARARAEAGAARGARPPRQRTRPKDDPHTKPLVEEEDRSGWTNEQIERHLADQIRDAGPKWSPPYRDLESGRYHAKSRAWAEARVRAARRQIAAPA